MSKTKHMRILSPATRWSLLSALITCVLWPQARAVEPDGIWLDTKELASLLTELENSLGSVTTLRAEFVQEKHLEIFQDVVTAQGIIYFSQPDQIRFEITEPFRSVLIAHGHSVAQYEYIRGNWQKLRTGGRDIVLQVTGQIASWLQGNFRENDIYTISAQRGAVTRIILKPKDESLAQHIGRIELELDAEVSRIVHLDIHEPSGDYTAIVFSNHLHNAKLSPDTFRTSGSVPAPGNISQNDPR